MSRKTVKLTEEVIRKVVSESVRSLLSEKYGIPNGIEPLADKILYYVQAMWKDGEPNSFGLKCDFVPHGYIAICPTKRSLRASYGAPPPGSDIPCHIFINPSIIENDGKNGNTLRATLIHELTHMIEDLGRHKNGGLAGEMDRIGHEKAFDNVIKKRMLHSNQDKYNDIEKDVNRVVYYGASFERNARNAAMFEKLKNVPKGSIKTYQDAYDFIVKTIEYVCLAYYAGSVNRLLSLTKEEDKREAMEVLEKSSNYHFKNWNQFCSWLRRNEEKYQEKMRDMIPKMIAAVMQDIN